MSVEINATNFPDSTFRTYITNFYDANRDGILSDAEIANAKVLDFRNISAGATNVTSLAGIEYLTALEEIRVDSNAYLSSINLGNATQLKKILLRCSSANFESLNLSACANLEDVTLIIPALTALDFSNCLKIYRLFAATTNLETLVLGNKPALKILNLGQIGDQSVSNSLTASDSLTALDLSQCPELQWLNISGNTGLTAINVSRCSKLTALQMRQTNIGVLNIVNNTELKTIYSRQNIVTIGSGNTQAYYYRDPRDGTTSDPDDANFTGRYYLMVPVATQILTAAITITQQPSGTTKNVGETAAFEIAASGSNLTFQWLKRLAGEIAWVEVSFDSTPGVSSELTLTAASTDDQAEFKCIVHSVFDDVEYTKESDAVKLTVISTPTIAGNPSNLTVVEGVNGEFAVTASGRNLNYQWQVSTDNGETYTDIENATSSSLTIVEPTTDLDGNKYKCKVTNTAGTSTSNAATLTVQVDTRSVTPSSLSLTEGQSGTLSVNTRESDLSYQWQSSRNYGANWNDIHYATAAAYQITAALSMNGYRYRCIVTTPVGSISSDAATLTVTADSSIAPPDISINPVDTTVNEGNTATFTVAAEGDDLSYQWQVQKDGGWQSIQGATGTSYSVVGTRQLNGSKYRCIVTNAAGAVYSLDAVLTVNQQSYISTPRILTQPHSATVALGSTVSFIVRADGGELSYQWQRLNGGQWYDLTGQTASACILTATSDLDGTQYRCAVSNTAGTTYTNIVLLSLTDGPIVEFYGYHSIIISGKNTYGEWEMYPTSRPHIAPPEVKTSYVDLPGADGGIDYTDLLTGEPRYGYRKGSWEFLLIPQDKWASVYRSLVSFLHGKVHTVILEDDPNYVYTGRLSVNEWQSAAHNSLITIDYILEPFPKNISGEDPSESDEESLNAAERLLRKPENAGMVIGIVNNTASVIDPVILFPDGDSIAY